MSAIHDPNVMAFRIERMRRAPRNWTCWIALFTALNGVFLALQQDFLILAGLVVPFVISGTAVPHFIAAAVFAALAYASSRSRAALVAAAVIYVLDAALATYAGLWAGVVMHLVVFGFVGMALAGARQLEKQRPVASALESLTAMRDSGLYIVTLNNEQAISVNANDPRIAHKCIQVSRLNCKFGKAKSLARRRENYGKVFGAGNVNFRAIALTPDIGAAERLVLRALAEWRVRGRTGRRNEWLVGISDAEVERIAFSTLEAAGIAFSLTDVTSPNFPDG